MTKQSQIQYVTELDTAKLQDLLNFVTILFCDLLDSVIALPIPIVHSGSVALCDFESRGSHKIQ